MAAKNLQIGNVEYHVGIVIDGLQRQG